MICDKNTYYTENEFFLLQHALNGKRVRAFINRDTNRYPDMTIQLTNEEITGILKKAPLVRKKQL
ncbi:MAG: hypothetical protein Q4G04_02290 [bacterium]|nr:hypothetical protein [bacterium]